MVVDRNDGNMPAVPGSLQVTALGLATSTLLGGKLGSGRASVRLLRTLGLYTGPLAPAALGPTTARLRLSGRVLPPAALVALPGLGYRVLPAQTPLTLSYSTLQPGDVTWLASLSSAYLSLSFGDPRWTAPVVALVALQPSSASFGLVTASPLGVAPLGTVPGAGVWATSYAAQVILTPTASLALAPVRFPADYY